MQQDVNTLLQSIYEEYQEALRRIARGYQVPACDTDDVVQETFIAYFKTYSLTWDSKRKKAMLVKILKNKCIDYFRKNSHYDKVSADMDDPCIDEDYMTRFIVEDPLNAIVDMESYEEVRRAIMGLRKEWKEMAMLYLIEEKSIGEICSLLGIPGTVCRSRIYRMRCCLRETLGPRFQLIREPELRSER